MPDIRTRFDSSKTPLLCIIETLPGHPLCAVTTRGPERSDRALSPPAPHDSPL